jgi:uncharacterized cupredoxin-like copper-binding protein
MTSIPSIPLIAAASAAAAALAVAGCGGSSASSGSSASTSTATSVAAATPPPAASSGGGQTVDVDADPGGALKFTQTTLHAKAGKVTLDMLNASGVPHSIAVEGNGVDKDSTATVSGGKHATVTASLKPGTYTFYCPVPGHKQAGMVGKLIVR